MTGVADDSDLEAAIVDDRVLQEGFGGTAKVKGHPFFRGRAESIAPCGTWGDAGALPWLKTNGHVEGQEYPAFGALHGRPFPGQQPEKGASGFATST